MTVKAQAKTPGWQKGNKRGPQSAEHRAKIKVANPGRAHTAEAREKMSRAKLGRRLTDTHRANIAAGQRARREQERETQQ